MPKIPKLSPYKRLVKEWKDCERCPLCKVRRQVVMARGVVPCEVLFVGEAPGESEDVLGAPFVGPAGKLLDEIIKVASNGNYFTMAFTNLVGCIPKDEATNRKNVEPLPKEIKACQPRLESLIKISKPSLIVAVGTLAAKHGKLQEWNKFAIMDSLPHPAFLLRLDVTRQDLEIQRAMVRLASMLEEVKERRDAASS